MTEPMRFPNGLDVRYEHKNAAKSDCFTESWVHRLSSEMRGNQKWEVWRKDQGGNDSFSSPWFLSRDAKQM